MGGGHGETKYDLMYYIKGAASGAICCSITHASLCPVDVVKTRMQLEPTVYNKGMVAAFKQVIKAEGVGALASGLGATAAGYAVQGWFKFGGVECVWGGGGRWPGTRSPIIPSHPR